MKVMKAMKRLKFWSRKKRKKKTHFLENPPPPSRPPPRRPPPPPPPLYCSCHWQCHNHVQPSAPPLPEWLEYEQSHEAILTSEVNTSSSGGLYNSSEAQFVSKQEDADSEISHDYTTSYQQYMIPNPVYDIPAVHESTKERAGGVFGCVFNILGCIFQCFKPVGK